MKKYLFLIGISIALAGTFTSCDEVENPFPPSVNVELDTNCYPGVWSNYVNNEWPDLASLPNDNPNRNVLIEDYTGHQCGNCPDEASDVHALYEANPSRIKVATIHASIQGMSGLQETANDYPVDFTNPNGLALGNFFGTTLTNTGFFGNPGINFSRKGNPMFTTAGNFSAYNNNVLNSDLKVNIKAVVNYFSQTEGYFLHTEIEKVDNSLSTDNLATTVYIIEDSLVAPQSYTNQGGLVTDYVHRDIHRGNLSGSTMGIDLNQGEEKDGKFYFSYSAKLLNQLASDGSVGTKNPENMHLLIYVYDKTTYEVYQVIKKKFV